ncbi:MAG: hypothetical protein IJ710_05685 [Prevotella sp.]|nr:hypothetical protein [Prevotella sp.]
MLGPIIEIAFGLAVWKLLPSLITTTKKKKKRVAFWCNVAGALLILLGAVHLLASLLSF